MHDVKPGAEFLDLRQNIQAGHRDRFHVRPRHEPAAAADYYWIQNIAGRGVHVHIGRAHHDLRAQTLM
jgi:hypothetical protein